MLAPNPAKTFPAFSGFVAAFREWRNNRRLLRQCRDGFAGCDSHEIERIAHDVGLSPNELRQMGRLGPDAARLLLDRMAALRLDASGVATNEPATMRDLQRLCSACVAKKRCQRDLVIMPNSPLWHQYCPNADTLDALTDQAANER
jgi:hypothetical protein